MPPTDMTVNNDTSFELVHQVLAYGQVPVHFYRSKRTGLTVILAEVDGPVVNGYFTLATEAFDDDGLPHTLEHLIFLGSEQYPYKGVLDLLANRCIASGTNAWTDVDHTCYTMETAGSGGFLSLMPIYLDHILYPTLTDEGFVTEVHHVNGEGEDAGVVYCEMQGCENSGDVLVHRYIQRKIYPERCGYSSCTGGIMKNLRESTTNEKVRNFHKNFYRPENLTLIITGQIKLESIFHALAPLENKIVAKGERGPYERPWQSPLPPFEKSEDLIVTYPSDDESNGMAGMAWRGPSAVTEVYAVTSCLILLKYLTDSSVAPLQKEFVEIEDPYASTVSYDSYENSECCFYLHLENVPTEKIPAVKSKLGAALARIANEGNVDMKRMKTIIARQQRELTGSFENNPHSAMAHILIGHVLYGNTKEDLLQRTNPLEDLDKLISEPKEYWLDLLNKYFVTNKTLSVQGIPSTAEQDRLAAEEKARIARQVARLGESGLSEKAKLLAKATEFNSRSPPQEMLTCVPTPSLASVNFHKIVRGTSATKAFVDVSPAPIFTYCDHIKSRFVYLFALLNTETVPEELRPYLPLLLETLFESPMERDGVILSHEEMIAQLQSDTVASGDQIGLSSAGRFRCGPYFTTVGLSLQVQPPLCQRGLQWLKGLLYQTKLTSSRLKIIATKMINDVVQFKRSGRGMVRYIMKALNYAPESNVQINGALRQQKFLTQLVEDLEGAKADLIIQSIEKLRTIITDPANLVLYCAANWETVPCDLVAEIKQLLPPEKLALAKPLKPSPVPDWKLLRPPVEGSLNHTIIGMGCLDNSQFYQTVPSINRYDDPDMPALLLYAQYLTQAEGPLWRHIRGKGFAYCYSILLQVNEGLLYLGFLHATNVVGAYKETVEIVTKQLTDRKWDETLLQSARSSLIYEFVGNDMSVGSVIANSLHHYFYDVPYEYNRTLLELINKVTVDDLNRVGAKYLSLLVDTKKVKTAIVCDPTKSEEIASGFKQFGFEFKVYPSIEESFLCDL